MRCDAIDLGALLELNNVSPKVDGIELGGALVNQVQQGNANLPMFVWQVPEGQPNEPLVRELLNSFTIRIYNDDYSAVLLDSGSVSRKQGNVSVVNDGLDPAGLIEIGPIKLGWVPSTAQWNDVRAALGNKHLVILGRLVTEEFRFLKTGDYFSDAFDFNVVA